MKKLLCFLCLCSLLAVSAQAISIQSLGWWSEGASGATHQYWDFTPGYVRFNPGDGYTEPPSISINTLTGATGSLLTSELLGGPIETIVIDDQGMNYDSGTPPSIEIIGGGEDITPATLTPIITGDKVTGITIVGGGFYKFRPIILIKSDYPAPEEPDTLQDTKSMWPNCFYIARSSFVDMTDDYRDDMPYGAFIKINPYNPSGSGKVPGPTTQWINQESFLRSDGLWVPQVATGSIIMYIGLINTQNLYQDIELPNAPGWLVCYGQPVNEYKWPRLYQYLKQLDNNTGNIRFLPDLSEKFIRGIKPTGSTPGSGTNPSPGSNMGQSAGTTAGSITLAESNLPIHSGHIPDGISVTKSLGSNKHTHTYTFHSRGDPYKTSGSWATTGNPSGNQDGEHSHSLTVSLTYALTNFGYADPDPITVIPAYFSMAFIIKT
jgi:hypothetical protein